MAMLSTTGHVSLVLLLLLAHPVTSIFVLEGSPTSYAQFRKWHAGLNGTLEFEFKTEDANGLLMYTDDGGTFDFFEVKLVEGALRLRFNLGGGASILTVGHNLHDNAWHKVSIIREFEETRLMVDKESQARISRGSEFSFGNFTTNSYVYIGGMPGWYASRLTYLALPSVIFEPRFRGAIRNLVFANDEGPPRRQEMIEYKGVRFQKLDVCEHQDPCQHGGVCISTDNGAICNCQAIDFEGPFCEKEKAPSEATFRGNDFLSVDLAKVGSEPIVSSGDEVSLFFKTRQPNGLLFYTGDGEDFLNLALKDGGVMLTINLGSGALEKQVKPSRVRFDDNQWHKVIVHRKVLEISDSNSFCHFFLTVDGVYTERGTTAGPFTMLSSSAVYVGGSDNTETLQGSRIRNNFVGCLRKVEFTADTLNLNLIELSLLGNKLITVHGNIQFMCQEVEAADPITFTNKESFLILPSWEGTRSGSISFKIRTNEPNGLLMYNSGATTAGGDFFAFEMMDGHIYLLLNLGSGAVKVKASNRRVDDGHWHAITLRRSGQTARVTVDESAADFVTPGESNQLDLEGALFVGGVGTSLDAIAVPVELWTGTLRYGYVGCMRDMVVNGNAVDIATYAKKQDSGSIRPACHTLPPQCDSQPCMNGGVCSEGWNRFICDCASTSFVGPTCGKDATTLSFNGEQHMKVTLPDESRTQAEDLVLRFRTTRPSGLLLASTTEKTTDRLEVAMELGRVKLAIHLGDKEKVMHAGSGLNDNQWHTLRMSRKGRSVELRVDDEPAVLGPSTKCSINACANRGVCIQQWNSYTCDCDMTSFTGPTCSDESIAYEFKHDRGLITFTFPPDKRPDTKGDLLALGFVTRKEKATLVRIDSSSSNDFMELGIVNGNMLMIYNMGTEDHPIGEMATKVNDGQYHVVRFTRSGANSTFQLDDYNVQIRQPGGRQLNVFNSQSRIQVGGRLNSVKNTIDQHFEGIVAGLVFNGLRVLDLASEHDFRITIKGEVTLMLSLSSIRPTRPYSGTRGETQDSRYQQTTATGGSETDDIVSSGSGCGVDDDEDCVTTLDTGSGDDDLITPVYIPTTTPKPRKTTTTPSTRKRPAEGSGKHCEDDDEDCEQGSGSGELGVFQPNVTPDDMFFHSTATGSPSTSTKAPETPHRPTLERPTQAPTTQPPDTMAPTLPEVTKAVFPSTTLPTTIWPPIVLRPTTDRPYTFVTVEDPFDGRSKTETGPPGSNAESTALVIGIIAGILIAIVLIILLVYKCRNRSDGSYKIDESKNYQFAASGGVGVSGSSLMLNGQRPRQMNGNLKMGEKANKLPKKKDLKDIKEWYV